METKLTKVYHETITLVNGDKLTFTKNKYFDAEIRAYENLEIEIIIKKYEAL